MDSPSTTADPGSHSMGDVTRFAVPHGEEARYYLEERYKTGAPRGTFLDLYYWVRPLLPRGIQIRLRKAYSRVQRKRAFPAWPIEPVLVELTKRELTRCLERAPSRSLPMVGYWPGAKRAAIVITHDVETAEGVANIQNLRKIEKVHGFVSSWNFVPERYPFDRHLLSDLVAEGCEVGVHGLYHDGRLFSSWSIFRERLPRINSYLREWGSVGFRSPALHRNPEWIPLIEAEYDSSYPDTDPFEPQPGGCCSIFPFELGRLIELPVTMPQDHTLFEILGQRDIALWKQKADWLIANRGMVLVIVHPDYMIGSKNLARYEALLDFLAGQDNCWRALPREVARWWRQRSGSSVKLDNDGKASIIGPAAGSGAIAWVSLDSRGPAIS